MMKLIRSCYWLLVLGLVGCTPASLFRPTETLDPAAVPVSGIIFSTDRHAGEIENTLHRNIELY
ncbi:MAG: hypothetical protein KDE51_20430, partial [Anaerolineales bacterium]|nr:hypothetical protein [Anaerolineales bacterium]